VHVEFLVAVISPFAVMFRMCAPLFPVVFITMWRTKAGLNSFPKRTYERLDEIARSYLSESTYNQWIEPRKELLYKLGGVGMYDEKEQKTASANKERELPVKPTLNTAK